METLRDLSIRPSTRGKVGDRAFGARPHATESVLEVPVQVANVLSGYHVTTASASVSYARTFPGAVGTSFGLASDEVRAKVMELVQDLKADGRVAGERLEQAVALNVGFGVFIDD
jgi:hypothetical protein